MHLLSLQFYYVHWTVKSPPKNSHRGWSDIRIDTSKYKCRLEALWAFLSPASAWYGKKKRKRICAAMCSVHSPKKKTRPCKNTTTQRTRHITRQREQKARLFVVSSSATAAHQVEENEWMCTWNAVTVVCFVTQFVIIISTTVHPPSALHMAHFFFSSFFHIRASCVTLSFITLPRWHRHKTGAAPGECALETMLSRWKEQVKWEKREEDKKRKRECVCEGCFFCLSAAVHGFLISSEITERDELSRVASPSTRASPAHPRARMELHEFPLLLFNGDGYPNKWAAFAWLSTAGSH